MTASELIEIVDRGDGQVTEVLSLLDAARRFAEATGVDPVIARNCLLAGRELSTAGFVYRHKAIEITPTGFQALFDACEYVAGFGGSALCKEHVETLAKRCRAAIEAAKGGAV